MPKEYLHAGRVYLHSADDELITEYRGEDLTEGAGQRLTQAPSVRLHWGPNDVQISVEYDVQQLRDVLAGVEDGSILISGSSQDQARVSIYTGVLSRSDLQRTIKLARRARDEVFGADE